jgi:hypothetical protein
VLMLGDGTLHGLFRVLGQLMYAATSAVTSVFERRPQRPFDERGRENKSKHDRAL